MTVEPEPTPRRQHSTLSSVRNAARLLKEFSHGSREIGVTDLSRRLGIGKSTAHRLLNTLAEERLLEQDPDTGAYRLGLAMYELGASVSMHTDLHNACIPVLDQLANATRETVQVAVLDGREVVYVERRESPQTLRLFGRVGHRNDAYCTSTGKLLMAFLPPQRIDALLDGWVLTPRTPHTITDTRRLRQELDLVRQRGWAENINEVEMGVASVAAPIRNGLGEVVASVSVAGPLQRLTGDSLKRFARPTVDAGLAISRRLGYREPATGRDGA
jgi:IclR family transcriptional regulator, KDG regulon repressor